MKLIVGLGLVQPIFKLLYDLDQQTVGTASSLRSL